MSILTEQQVIDNSYAVDPPKSGIYFLIYKGEIVYVGQSIDVANRHIQHRNGKQFDRVSYVLCPIEQLNDMEATYILAFKPALNTAVPPNTLFTTLETIKRKNGIGLRTIKKFIKAQNLEPIVFNFQEYYRLDETSWLAQWMLDEGIKK